MILSMFKCCFNSLHAGYFFTIVCRLLIFFKINFYKNFVKEYRCQTVRIQAGFNLDVQSQVIQKFGSIIICSEGVFFYIISRVFLSFLYFISIVVKPQEFICK